MIDTRHHYISFPSIEKATCQTPASKHQQKDDYDENWGLLCFEFYNSNFLQGRKFCEARERERERGKGRDKNSDCRT